MSEKVQVGLRVDRDLYEKWKQAVKDRCGRWKGAGGQELERMMREDIAAVSGQNDEIDAAAIDERLARIEAAVKMEATDGGTDTSQPSEDTHTPSEDGTGVPDEKPHAKGPTEEKVAWLIGQYHAEYGTDGEPLQRMHKGLAREIIDDEYTFAEDRAERYAEKMLSKLDMVEHPAGRYDEVYVTENRFHELREEQREEREQAARDDARETTRQLEADE